MDLAALSDSDEARPALVGSGAAAVVEALVAGAIVAVPNVGGYSLAVRSDSLDGEARLVELAADPDGPHYAVGQIDDVRALTSGWTDELRTLLQRCWPGPLEVFLPSAGSGAGAGAGATPRRRRRRARPGDAASDAAPDDGRARVRRLGCRGGHARRAGTAAALPRARPVAHGPSPLHRARRKWRRPSAPADVAVVVDGGRREGPPPTVVDATLTPIRVLREGALPASFIEGTMLMSTRRKLFSRHEATAAG